MKNRAKSSWRKERRCGQRGWGGRRCGRKHWRGINHAQVGGDSSSQLLDAGESQDGDEINENKSSANQNLSANSEYDNSDSDASDPSCYPQRVGCFGRHQWVPSRYQCTSGTDSHNNDGTSCASVKKNEPDDLAVAVVFWVDCSKPGLGCMITVLLTITMPAQNICVQTVSSNPCINNFFYVVYLFF